MALLEGMKEKLIGREADVESFCVRCGSNLFFKVNNSIIKIPVGNRNKRHHRTITRQKNRSTYVLCKVNEKHRFLLGYYIETTPPGKKRYECQDCGSRVDSK